MKKNYIVFDNKKYLYINEDVNNITLYFNNNSNVNVKINNENKVGIKKKLIEEINKYNNNTTINTNTNINNNTNINSNNNNKSELKSSKLVYKCDKKIPPNCNSVDGIKKVKTKLCNNEDSNLEYRWFVLDEKWLPPKYNDGNEIDINNGYDIVTIQRNKKSIQTEGSLYQIYKWGYKRIGRRKVRVGGHMLKLLVQTQ